MAFGSLLATFGSRAINDCAGGGAGLYPANCPGKDGKKTAAVQALEIFFAVAVEFVKDGKNPCNVIMIFNDEAVIFGARRVTRSIIAELCGRNQHIDYLCVADSSNDFREKAAAFDPDRLRYGAEDDNVQARGLLIHEALCKAYLKKTQQSSMHQAVAYDVIYAINGRPFPFNRNEKEIHSLIDAAVKAVDDTIGEGQFANQFNDDPVTLLQTLVYKVRNRMVGSDARIPTNETARFLIYEAAEIDTVRILHQGTAKWHTTTFGKVALKPSLIDQLGCISLGDADSDAARSKVKFGRAFAAQEHVNTAYFAIGNGRVSRTAVLGRAVADVAGSADGVGSHGVRNVFNRYVPLHHHTPAFRNAYRDWLSRQNGRPP